MRKLTWLIIGLTAILSSCSVTRSVPKGQYVVNKISVEVKGNQNISTSKLKKYIQQPQLRRFLGIPVYAYIYNIPDPKKDSKREKRKEQRIAKANHKIEKRYDLKTARLQAKRNKYYLLYQQAKDSLQARKYYEKYYLYAQKVNKRKNERPDKIEKLKKNDVFTWWEFLRKIGQQPPLYNPVLIERSATYLKNYMTNLGYYNAKVDVETKTKGKKIDIKFVVYPGKPLIIDSVEYVVRDTEILSFIQNQPKLQLKRGHILSVKYLQDYRNQLTNYLTEDGFYYFSREYITFEVDTNGRGNKAKVFVKISQPYDREGRPRKHRRYYINNIYIFSDYNPNQALENPDEFFSGLDTTVVYTKKDSLPYYFIRKHQYVIKPKYILKEIYIKPHSLYRFSAVRNTYLHLSKFAIYKLVDIDFKELSDTSNLLDCNIRLTPAQSQSIAMEIVGTNSSPTIGGAINIIYKHKNLFHGGEIFSLKYHTALEIQKFYIANLAFDSLFNFNTREFGIDARLMFPRLLLPFSPGEFVEKNNPRTVVQFSYNFQDRPEYNRMDLTYTWSYYWKANIYTNHILTPSRISSVTVWDMIPEFRQYIEESYLTQSYENYFIFGTSYTFTFSNQGEKRPNTFYFQLNFSSSGNLLYEIMKLTKVPTVDGSYYMPGFKTIFAQFVKLDYDFRVYHNFLNNSRLVWRLFMGAGVPYKNSKVLPFGERYFIGGSNSIRAWQARTLGPGSYSLPTDIRYPNQTGDIRLETNLEYRYPIIWKLEGATFLDVGNIWAINKYDGRPGALFEWDKFYKQLAVGTGMGIRLNLGLFVIRTDVGVKLYDPAAPEGQRFIPASRQYTANDFTLNIAIGYPF